MNSPHLPSDALQSILHDALRRGRIYRERGGSFQTGISMIDYDTKRRLFTMVYFPARYPARRYSADGVLIPEEPFIPDGASMRGFEHVTPEKALAKFQSGVEPLTAEARSALESLLQQQEVIPPTHETTHATDVKPIAVSSA